MPPNSIATRFRKSACRKQELMQIACYLATAIFGLFTYWQFDDLEQYGTQFWYGWVLAYGATALVALISARRPPAARASHRMRHGRFHCRRDSHALDRVGEDDLLQRDQPGGKRDGWLGDRGRLVRIPGVQPLVDEGGLPHSLLIFSERRLRI
jgi:hypothetical protein